MSATQPDGYLAVPASGSGSPVLVLHAWWGLNDTIRALCDRLAGEGYLAFAPDLYHGKVTDQIAEAETLSSALDEAQAWQDVDAALTFLKSQAADTTQGLAVIGFSLGAYFALALSDRSPEQVRAVVLFYGTGPTDFNNSQAAYLGHFAEQDPYEPRENVDELEQALQAAGRPVNFYHYSDTGHWFFESDRADAYAPAAAELAWSRTLDFLKAQAG